MLHDLKEDLKEQGYDKEEEFFRKEQQALLEKLKKKKQEAKEPRNSDS